MSEPAMSDPVRQASIPADGPAGTEPSGMAGLWNALCRRTARMLSPAALAVGLMLGVSLGVSALLQFGSGVYEVLPGLSMLAATFHAALSVLLGLLVALSRRDVRVSVAVGLVACAIFLISLGCLGAKLEYQRGLAGNRHYALPHHPVAAPAGAQAVAIKTADGVRLAGTLMGEGHARAIVIYPAWRTDRNAFATVTLAQWLANTYTVLVLDPRGQGESDGVKSPAGHEKFDVLAGVAYLRAKGHAHIGVVAEQGAGYPAMLAASTRRDIDSLAVVAPSAGWGESLAPAGSLEDPRRLFGRLYWRVVAGLRLAPGPDGPPALEVVSRVAPTPLLIVGLKGDYLSPAEALYQAAGEPKSLILHEGDGRPTTWARFADYYQTLKQWFDFSLRPAAEPPQPAVEVSEPG